MIHWPGAREDLFSGGIADLPGAGVNGDLWSRTLWGLKHS